MVTEIVLPLVLTTEHPALSVSPLAPMARAVSGPRVAPPPVTWADAGGTDWGTVNTDQTADAAAAAAAAAGVTAESAEGSCGIFLWQHLPAVLAGEIGVFPLAG